MPDAVLDDIAEWQRRELAGVDRVRVVPRANLHITLAFLGRRPTGEVPAIMDALRRSAGGASPIEFVLRPRGYRETRSVGMLVLDDLHGTASALADDLFERLERLGVYRREKRPWLPHVTFVRFDRPPRLAPNEARLGRFSPSDAALYTSLLRPTGAQYEVVESVALGG